MMDSFVLLTHASVFAPIQQYERNSSLFSRLNGIVIVSSTTDFLSFRSSNNSSASAFPLTRTTLYRPSCKETKQTSSSSSFSSDRRKAFGLHATSDIFAGNRREWSHIGGGTTQRENGVNLRISPSITAAVPKSELVQSSQTKVCVFTSTSSSPFVETIRSVFG